MNLIEKLGIEKCRQIVDGAPEWALAWCPTTEPSHPYTDACEGVCEWCVEIRDLRTAIANHNTDSVTDIRNHISPNTVVIER